MHLRLVLLAVGLSASTHAAAQTDLYAIDTVRTIEITAPSNWRTLMANNYSSQALIKVDVTIDGVTYKDCGARHRGFSSYRFLPRGKEDKRPWKILLDEFVADQDVQGYSTLNLNNNIWDPSLVREVAGFEFFRKFIPAPKSCYCWVRVNNEDLGLFTNTQQVNKDFLKEHFRDRSGNRYRGDRTQSGTSYNDSALIWLGNNLSRYQAAYELKTENGQLSAWTGLIHAIDKLNNTANAQLATEVPKVLDVDNALRFIGVANTTVWLDSYLGRVCKNFYLYEDPFHGRFSLQPWDLNNGFGGLTFGLGTTGAQRMAPFYQENNSSSPRPVFSQLVKVPAWRARYLAHLRSMRDEMTWAKMDKRMTELRNLIRPHLQRDAKRIYSMTWFDDALTRSINVGFVTVPPLQPFFQGREAFLASHAELNRPAPDLSALARSVPSPSAQDRVWITAKVSGVAATAVTLHYRVRGPFIEAVMHDDGQHGDGQAGDGVYGAAIPPQPGFAEVEYWVSANRDLSNGGGMRLLPATGSYRAPGYRVRPVAQGPIRISELVADNETGIRDNMGETEDWIELRNDSNAAQVIGGMYLTDNASELSKWQLPANLSIPAYGRIIIWADDETQQGSLHASFKLSKDGEEVALVAADGTTVLDWVEFGPQLDDVSTGRPDGRDDLLVTFPAPTPGAPNRPTPCGYLAYRGADPSSAEFVLAGTGQPKPGQNMGYALSGAAPGRNGLLFAGRAAALEVPGLGALLLDPLAMLPLGSLSTDAQGAAAFNLTLPNNPSLAGKQISVQAAVDAPGGIALSNGVWSVVCQ